MLLLSVVVLSACARGPREGLYRRADPIRTADGDTIPILQMIRMERGGVFEADMVVARIRGTYRLERDSIFFDEPRPGGGAAVAMAGRFVADTLAVRIVGVELLTDGAVRGTPLRFIRS